MSTIGAFFDRCAAKICVDSIALSAGIFMVVASNVLLVVIMILM